jgi:hypothetical protein
MGKGRETQLFSGAATGKFPYFSWLVSFRNVLFFVLVASAKVNFHLQFNETSPDYLYVAFAG